MSISKRSLKALRPFVKTEKQSERLKAYIEHKTRAEACEALGISLSSLKKSMRQVRRYARESGFQPSGDVFTPIQNHFVKGESALLDENGVVKQKWIKTDTDTALKMEMLQKAIIEVFEDYKGSSPVVEAIPAYCEEDLLCLIPIGDAHVGMLAWDKECGEDFDLKIAERDLCTAMERLIESAPNAKTCLIADMGDFLHRNDNKNSTPASGNVLDVDGRAIKMMRVAVKILIHSVNLALGKFENVVLRNVFGNHSPEGEQMLSLALELYFHNNPRVKVESTPNKFYYYQHGETLLGFCHGDKIKQGELPMIMASDVPQMWGSSQFRYFFIGHVHHHSLKEYQGCSVESINTLTPNDAWHHGSGYRARKNIKLIVLHKKYGEIERVTKDISMIRGE